jgi:glucosylceramidase
MENLFGSQGIDLNFLRIPMGASDFTANGIPYTYDDMPPGQTDPALAHFSIAHDDAYILPALRAALAVNGKLTLLANPWSPPAGMKANDSLDNLDGQGSVLPAAYPVLAQYFVDFLKAYAAAGVPVSEITPQNEPLVPSEYPGAEYSPTQEATFIADDLAPALQAAGLDTKIYGYDFNWAFPSYPESLIESSADADLSGIAWHCYQGNPDTMGQFAAEYPSFDEIVSECSPELLGFSPIELLISSLRNGASAVAVWNLALSPTGGPVEPPDSGCRGCTGVITANETTHKVRYTAKYYQLGQVSKFVRPGAVRIGASTDVTYSTATSTSAFRPSAGIDAVAFRNPDGTRVLITSNTASRAEHFSVGWEGKSFPDTLAAGAVATFTWR